MKLIEGFILLCVVAVLLFAYSAPVGDYSSPDLSASQPTILTPNIFNLHLSSPTRAYFGQNITFYANLTYGVTNYSLTIFIAGYNLSGLGPQPYYHFYNATSGDFNQSIVMPNSNGTVTLYAEAQASGTTGYVNATASVNIQVVYPLTLNAIISNPSGIPIRNTTVNFEIDGATVGTKVVAEIAPYSSIQVSINVIPPQLSTGTHTLSILVNNPSAKVDGQTSYSSQFYYGTPPNFTWIYYVAAAVVAFMVFMVLLAGSRPRNLPRKPKWKK